MAEIGSATEALELGVTKGKSRRRRRRGLLSRTRSLGGSETRGANERFTTGRGRAGKEDKAIGAGATRTGGVSLGGPTLKSDGRTAPRITTVRVVNGISGGSTDDRTTTKPTRSTSLSKGVARRESRCRRKSLTGSGKGTVSCPSIEGDTAKGSGREPEKSGTSRNFRGRLKRKGGTRGGKGGHRRPKGIMCRRIGGRLRQRGSGERKNTAKSSSCTGKEGGSSRKSGDSGNSIAGLKSPKRGKLTRTELESGKGGGLGEKRGESGSEGRGGIKKSGSNGMGTEGGERTSVMSSGKEGGVLRCSERSRRSGNRRGLKGGKRGG